MPGSFSRMIEKAGMRRLGDPSPDEPYLSYYDVRVTRGDLDSIKSNDWLTDNAIAFWQEYLEREELTNFPKASIVLLRPSMAYMLRQSADPLAVKEALPNFSRTTHIFLPINDNSDAQAEGGSHWSLLLVSIIDGVSFHYSSMAGCNDREARSTTMKLEQLLGKRLRFIPMADSPQQENGSDCGVFVCVLMRHLLLKRLLRADASKKVSMSMRDAHIDAKDGRKTMLKVIEDRRIEGKRRSSRSHSPFRNPSAHSKSPPRIGDEQSQER
ncbi:ULP1 Protease Ulp1 family [Pyrenophora tritici-repentis]|uniref:C-terminal catalytic domain containing protein n=1 Tax=Pyrenophora tritici-repentis TaxID=45151 RepID=A0A2W1F3T7_9PLEO|nr:ULP1 Protease Ulp1 family [Pyrenophora tritici-repentis]KAF7452072.1 ULP1 Protease- Ulp1 family [Pyrenophora tritici-repentis]KAF7574810.1 ULP1, Protease, Ulp1 family [Pyrenophora tritici-repentis]KAG9386423.1 ULP1 Protease [Pyrenophora tritici-repentis]KAI0588535.1 ULP1 Protease Ulp1 family [Pyrenophora tritici-repentis]